MWNSDLAGVTVEFDVVTIQTATVLRVGNGYVETQGNNVGIYGGQNVGVAIARGRHVSVDRRRLAFEIALDRRYGIGRIRRIDLDGSDDERRAGGAHRGPRQIPARESRVQGIDCQVVLCKDAAGGRDDQSRRYIRLCRIRDGKCPSIVSHDRGIGELSAQRSQLDLQITSKIFVVCLVVRLRDGLGAEIELDGTSDNAVHIIERGSGCVESKLLNDRQLSVGSLCRAVDKRERSCIFRQTDLLHVLRQIFRIDVRIVHISVLVRVPYRVVPRPNDHNVAVVIGRHGLGAKRVLRRSRVD